MNIEITQKAISETGKYGNFTVKEYSFWGKEVATYKIRIVSRDVIAPNKFKSLIEQVIERKEEWKQGKKRKYLPLKEVNANAYIFEQQKEKEDDTDNS